MSLSLCEMSGWLRRRHPHRSLGCAGGLAVLGMASAVASTSSYVFPHDAASSAALFVSPADLFQRTAPAQSDYEDEDEAAQEPAFEVQEEEVDPRSLLGSLKLQPGETTEMSGGRLKCVWSLPTRATVSVLTCLTLQEVHVHLAGLRQVLREANEAGGASEGSHGRGAFLLRSFPLVQ